MSNAITHTTAGTRPGDNLADLVFAFIYSKMLNTFRTALESEGFSTFESLPVDADYRSCTVLPVDKKSFPQMLDITWADDLVLLLHDESALEIDKRLALISGTLLDMCWQRGLLPNFRKGKSECMIRFKGKHSKEQRIKYFTPAEPVLPVPSTMRSEVVLRIVPQYKHLGNQIHMTLHQTHEIRVRIAQTKAAYAKHRQRIYQNPQIAQPIRLRLLNTMVLSILNYNMGTWRPLTPKEWTMYEGAVMFLYRGLLRATHPHEELLTWPHEKVLAALEAPSAWDLLALARLRYLGSLWRSGPQEVWWLCHLEKRWFAGVDEAFQWLNLHTGGLHTRRHAELRAQRWSEILVDPRAWKTFLRKAQKHAIATNKADAYLRAWHFDFVATAVSLGLDLSIEHVIARGLCLDQDPPDTCHGCIPCQMTFTTHAAWAVHAYKIHSRIAPERRLIQDSKCRICLKDFHTTARLLRHLRYSTRCTIELRNSAAPSVLLPGIGNTKSDRDRPLPLPVTRYLPEPEECQEPRPLADADIEDTAHKENHNAHLLATFLKVLDEWGPTNDIHMGHQSCIAEIKTIIEDYDIIHKTVQQAINLCTGDERQLVHRLALEPFGLRLFRQVLDDIRFEKVIPAPSVHRSAKQIRGATMDGLHSARHMHFTWKPVEEVPRPCTKHMLIYYIFSVDIGDLKISHISYDIQAPAGIYVTLVPIDDPEKCDLSQSHVRDRWLFYTRTGCVLGMIAGPPCETFSRSRRLGGIAGETDGDGGPRMLRSRLFPFGLPKMKADEREHVHLSNVLLLFVHDMALALLAWKRRFFLKEHPLEPPEAEAEDLPSSWDVGSCQVLRSHSEVRTLNFSQGLLGAKSPKPTTFLLRGLATIEEEIERESTFAMPRALAMGKTSKEKFATAALKAYPPQLCRAIGTSVKAHITSFTDEHDHSLTFEAMDAWVHEILAGANYDAVMGADRAGHGV